MVPDLFRVRSGEAGERRPAMAKFHRHGRVLPERPIADLDWLVCTAFAALVSRSERICHVGHGTWASLDVIPSQAIADRLFFYRDPVADPGHPDCELHVLELSGSLARGILARRSLHYAHPTCALEHATAEAVRCYRAEGQQTSRLVGQGSPAVESSEICGEFRPAVLDFLCGHRGNAGEVTIANGPSRLSRAIPHRQPVWTVCRDDARALRNRVPGIQ